MSLLKQDLKLVTWSMCIPGNLTRENDSKVPRGSAPDQFLHRSGHLQVSRWCFWWSWPLSTLWRVSRHYIWPIWFDGGFQLAWVQPTLTVSHTHKQNEPLVKYVSCRKDRHTYLSQALCKSCPIHFCSPLSAPQGRAQAPLTGSPHYAAVHKSALKSGGCHLNHRQELKKTTIDGRKCGNDRNEICIWFQILAQSVGQKHFTKPLLRNTFISKLTHMAIVED